MDEDDYTSGLQDSSGNNNHGASNGATPVLDTTQFKIEIVNAPSNGAIVDHLDGTASKSVLFHREP